MFASPRHYDLLFKATRSGMLAVIVGRNHDSAATGSCEFWTRVANLSELDFV